MEHVKIKFIYCIGIIQFPAGIRDFFLLKNIHTGSRNYPISRSVCTGCTFCRGKVQSPLSSDEVKSEWSCNFISPKCFNNMHSYNFNINPLTPNSLYSGRAVNPLNSRTATIVAANSVSKFGGILFVAPIRLFTVVCYAAGPLKVRLSFRRQIVLPPPPKPLHIRRYICLRLVNAHFSTMT